MSLISGLCKFYANSMSAPGSLKTIEIFSCLKQKKQLDSLFNNLIAKSFYLKKKMCPGLVFIEKLQNSDLMMTSFAASGRPNNDI